MSFKTLLGKELLFFDGAMGTMLQNSGLEPGELPELWNFSHAEIIENVHREYLKAGANIIKTNTFGANRLKFVGMNVSVDEVISAAVKNARNACKDFPKSFVALDLGPTGKLLEPFGDLPFEETIDIYAEVVIAGVKAGADLILIETMSDSYETKAAILAAKENSDLPIVVTMTFDEDGKLLTGADIISAVAMVQGLGVDAIGFNCGLGPIQMQELLPELLSVCSLPIVLNPNAGLPVECDGKTIFNVEPSEFAAIMKTIIPNGVWLAGGCCGTTPAHIEAMVKACFDLKINATKSCEKTVVSGYGKAVIIAEDPIIIGERINPTGKPRLKAAILEENFDYICRLGIEQIEHNAHILDVNVGVPGINEADISVKTVKALQAITSIPLQIDTSDYKTMEAALRIYNGKALLNSVNGKEESMSKVFPIAKKYGAVIVALTLDDEGIPETAAGRIAIADKIIKRAESYGISKHDIIIDPLALTISTGADNANIDLEVLRELKKRNIRSVMGVSNISFGLPARDAVNSAFFALVLEAGLSAAIINPQSKSMLDTYHAYRALKGYDTACKKYVEYFGDTKSNVVATILSEYTLYEAIVKGMQGESVKAVKKLLATMPTLEIINEQMIPALDYVGNGFENKTLFLPQLLMSAEAAKAAFEVIKSEMTQVNAMNKDVVVILATVKGDIHDIGKNIVKVLFENYGYRVIDLGKDVAIEKVVEAVKANNANFVGLSALMTTTVSAMEATIKALNEISNTKIIVGGAVLTQEYADKINADYYAPNAVSAVTYVNDLLKE